MTGRAVPEGDELWTVPAVMPIRIPVSCTVTSLEGTL